MDETTLHYAVQGINSQLEDIKRSLANVSTKLDEHPSTCPLYKQVERLEVRVSKLEKFKYLLMGASAAAGGVVGTVLANVAKLVQ